MKIEEVKRNMIVVVKEGQAFGNDPGTITKVIGLPGEVTDEYFYHDGKRRVSDPYGTYWHDYVHVLAFDQNGKLWHEAPHKFNNAPSFLEYLDDIRPATEEEKKQWRRIKKNMFK